QPATRIPGTPASQSASSQAASLSRSASASQTAPIRVLRLVTTAIAPSTESATADSTTSPAASTSHTPPNNTTTGTAAPSSRPNAVTASGEKPTLASARPSPYESRTQSRVGTPERRGSTPP